MWRVALNVLTLAALFIVLSASRCGNLNWRVEVIDNSGGGNESISESSEKDITAFSIDDRSGIISGTNITVLQ